MCVKYTGRYGPGIGAASQDEQALVWEVMWGCVWDPPKAKGLPEEGSVSEDSAIPT